MDRPVIYDSKDPSHWLAKTKMRGSGGTETKKMEEEGRGKKGNQGPCHWGRLGTLRFNSSTEKPKKEEREGGEMHQTRGPTLPLVSQEVEKIP